MLEKKDKLDTVFDSLIVHKKKKEINAGKMGNMKNMENKEKDNKIVNIAKLDRIPCTYKYEKDVVSKVKAYAYWKRSEISDVLNAVLKAFIQAVEKEEGEIKPIPTETIQPIKSIKVE